MNQQPFIVIIVPNLMFSVKIEDAARAVNLAVFSPTDPAAFVEALRNGARLAIIDADTQQYPWLDWVRAAKDNPATDSVPILAFGSHVNAALRDRALAAGVDRYMARSNFAEGLHEIIATMAREITDEPCGEAPPISAMHGIEEFNAGHYFEQHETLEIVWRAEMRPVRDLYRGILQIGLACYQIERGNARGAIKMIDRAKRWLQPFRPACQTIDVDRLLADAAALRNEIERLGVDRFSEFDRALFPTVHLLPK